MEGSCVPQGTGPLQYHLLDVAVQYHVSHSLTSSVPQSPFRVTALPLPTPPAPTPSVPCLPGDTADSNTPHPVLTDTLLLLSLPQQLQCFHQIRVTAGSRGSSSAAHTLPRPSPWPQTYLEGLRAALLLVHPDEEQAEQETQAEEDEQQGVTPGGQVEVGVAKHQDGAEADGRHHQGHHSHRDHLAWVKVAEELQVGLKSCLQLPRLPVLFALVSIHQLELVGEGLVLLQLAGGGALAGLGAGPAASWLRGGACLLLLEAQHDDAGSHKGVGKQRADGQELHQGLQVKDEGQQGHEQPKDHNANDGHLRAGVHSGEHLEEEPVLGHGIDNAWQGEEVAQQDRVHC